MRVNIAGFLFAEGLRGMVRHRGLSVAALLSTIASYVILALFLVVLVNLRHTVASVSARKEVVAFLRDDVSEDSVQVLTARMRALRGVEATRFVSKEQALEELRNELGEAQSLVDAVGQNPLPRSIRISLTRGARLGDSIAILADTITTMAGVEDVRYGEEWVERLDALVARVRLITLVVGGMIALSALLVVIAATRLSSLARRDLVEILRMVGASGGFIRGPFLAEAVVLSAFAMGVALLIAYGLEATASRWIPALAFLNVQWMLASLAASVLIGLVGGLIALADVLRRTAPSR